AAAPQPAPATDAQKLLGAWKVTSMIIEGVEPPAPANKEKHFMYITKDLIYMMSGDEVRDVIIYQIDATQKPKAIDLRSGDGTTDLPGIYLLQGNDLKICVTEDREGKSERPTAFVSKAGSKAVLITLKRDPTAPNLDMKKVDAQLKLRDDRRAGARNLHKLAL